MNNVTVWEKTRQILAENLSPALFKICFAKTAVASIEKNGAGFRVVILCPNNFAKEQIEKKCGNSLTSALKKVLSEKVELELATAPPGSQTFENQVALNFKENGVVVSGNGSKLQAYTFENFVVGESNRLAYSASLAVATKPGVLYNPLFIYGGTGLGKTHLLRAVAQKLSDASLDLKVAYKTTETFTNEFVDALSTGTVRAFRERYRRLGVLLIDDVHFLSGKPSTQDEFFHTFNELYSARCQIVLTSDRHPTEIGKLTDRLVSRFLGGLTCDIAPPELELKMAILSKKAKIAGLALDSKVCQFLAEITLNPREVEGVVAVLTQSVSLGEPLNLEVVGRLFGKKQQQTNSSPKQIVSVVSRFYGLKSQDVTGISRKKEVVRARQMVMFLLRSELGLSYEFIGKILGARDHSTIIHGFESFRLGLEKTANLKEDLFEVKRELEF